jgi:AraC family transcriptional regulator of adaptative response/methylated-DNA-[protein]-cysteine methyltransferase
MSRILCAAMRTPSHQVKTLMNTNTILHISAQQILSAAQLLEHCRRAPPLPLAELLAINPNITAFQQQVWQLLLAIPSGYVTDYQAIAEALGKPKASRAVGNAIGSNPLAIKIPCHRVIRKDGQLGGYRWGVDKKIALLKKELGG